jgi:hypothetical protein
VPLNLKGLLRKTVSVYYFNMARLTEETAKMSVRMVGNPGEI